MDLFLSDKVVLITGSSKGIGYYIAEAFLAEGAKVMITGRDKKSLLAAEKSLGEIDKLVSFCGDMTDPAQIKQAVSEAVARFGALDIVVANVGKGSVGGIEISQEQWKDAMQANFFGSMEVAMAAIPHLIKTKGNIIFISSIAGLESIGASLPYSAAKAALISAMKGLSKELGPKEVRVNAIAPGNILFPGGRWEKNLQEREEFFEDFIQSNVPLQRFGTPEEIANVVLFLASSRSSFTTGSCVVVDGGQTKK